MIPAGKFTYSDGIKLRGNCYFYGTLQPQSSEV